jgi:3-hydroxyacyl-[acyl-carrier-protein] dehydratase/UDP-3-O-[3-hydroxymyristoyl] N-acetylglucosamine deacetylase/3-hydroxyacyl-[acyl-carrier-protein] dehydratase
LINIEGILQVLPHRYPFLLVDRVLSMEPGKSIAALKNVTYNEPFFQGHFPGMRIMPGVLIVEAIAQAGGILIYHTVPNPETKFVLLAKIENVRFRKPVIPGDQLRLEADLVKLKSKFLQLHGRALVEGEIVVEGDLMASLLEKGEMNGRT